MSMEYNAADHWGYLNMELKAIERLVRATNPQGEQAIFAHNVQQYLKGRMKDIVASAL